MYRPMPVTLISLYVLLNAVFSIIVLLLLGPIMDKKEIIERMGLSHDFLFTFTFIIAMFGIILAYGYYRLTSWGFWLMVSYTGIYSLLHIVQLMMSRDGSVITLMINLGFLLFTLRNRYVFYQS